MQLRLLTAVIVAVATLALVGCGDSGGGDGGTDTGSTDETGGPGDGGDTARGTGDEPPSTGGPSSPGVVDVGDDTPDEDLEPLLPGDLVVSEVMQDPNAVGDADGEWIELHHRGDEPVDLRGCRLESVGDHGHVIEAAGPIVIGPGEYLVLGLNSDFDSNGGVDVAYEYDDVRLANGEDDLQLYCRGDLIDAVAFGGAGWPAVKGASLQVDPTALAAGDNDDVGVWCAGQQGFGAGDRGTPGAPNDHCGDPCDDVVCDSPPPPACAAGVPVAYEHAGTCSDGACAYPKIPSAPCGAGEICKSGACVPEGTAVPAPKPGELLFTEIMKNPAAVADIDGEWFELKSLATAEVDLAGCLIHSLHDDDHFIYPGGPWIVAPGAVIVLGIETDPEVNGGVTLDYAYGEDIVMSNGADVIAIVCDGEVVDSVTWEDEAGFPDGAGVAMALDPSVDSAADNDDSTSWCAATTSYGAGDLGTPGSANSGCDDACEGVVCDDPPPPGCEGAVAVVYGAVGACTGGACGYPIAKSDDCGASGMTCVAGTCQETGAGGGGDTSEAWPKPGGLVITEIMNDPAAVSDGAGEWFEVYNPGALAVELSGCQLDGGSGSPHVLADGGSLGVAAGGFALLGNNADPATNGGIALDYAYPTSVSLGNGSDSLTILCDGATIDAVAWDDGATFPDPKGASMQLDPGSMTAEGNDVGGSWCAATTALPSGDLATPGGPNTVCGEDVDDPPGGGDDPAPDGGNCCEAQAGAGCSDPACELVVCAVDDFCCDSEWDLICAGIAQLACSCEAEHPPETGDGPCCVGHTGQGCEDAACSATVCAADAHCCDAVWDASCAAKAAELCEACGGGGGGTTAWPAPGQAVISEVMANPAAVPDSAGEWFEIRNGTDEDLDLQGCSVETTAKQHTIDADGPLPLPAGGRVVLAVVGDPTSNGGVPVDYDYPSTLALENGADELTLRCGDTVTSSVSWESAQAGVARQVDADGTWCLATEPFGSGDLGTPGEPNTACVVVPDPCAGVTCDAPPAPECDGETAVTYAPSGTCSEGACAYDIASKEDCAEVGQVCEAGACEAVDVPDDAPCCSPHLGTGCGDEACSTVVCNADDFCCATQWDAICAAKAAELCEACGGGGGGGSDPTAWPAAGEVAFSEIMANPAAVADSAGEWFELRHVTGGAHELAGCVVQTATGSHTLDAKAPSLGPAGYAVLAIQGDPSANGGVEADYDYPSSLSLTNSSGVLSLVCGDDTVASASWTDAPSGVALQADAAGVWCAATTPYGAGDLGSPGAANPACGGGGDPVDGPDCCAAHDGTGCGDGVCEAQVCNADAFCCESEWDGLCADQANELCVGCGGGGPDPDPVGDWPGPGEVQVTELMANPAVVGDSAGEWFELRNLTSKSLDLAGCEVATGSASHTIASSQPLPLGAGAYVVLAVNGDSSANGGVQADYDYPGTISLKNSGDTLTVACGGAVVASWTWVDSEAGVATQLDDAGGVCLATTPYGAGDLGTPGSANPGCDGGDPVDPSPEADHPGPGDLEVTELMANPAAVSDSAGEWLELHNLTSKTFSLEGCELMTASSSHTIGTAPDVGPGAYYVLGVNGDPGANGGVTVDYDYPGTLSLTNSGGSVAVMCGTGVVAAWDWDSTTAGVAAQVDGEGVVCDAKTPYGDGDLGTPGGANPSCSGGGPDPDPAGDCCEPNGTAGCEDAGCQAAVCDADGFCCESEWDDLCADQAAELCEACGGGGGDDPTWPGPGQVVIAELMQNPAAVSDSAGEWLELQSLTNAAFDLGGCVLATGSNEHTVGGTLDIAAFGQVVLAVNADPAANGGVDADYDLPGSLSLKNSADTLTLSCGGQTIDSVGWDASEAGVSWQKDGDGQWCAGTTPYGDGDLGTPGVENPACDDPPPAGDSSCCGSHDGAGCDDASCQAMVCGGDAFCCETEWDDLCAQAAGDCAVCQ